MSHVPPIPNRDDGKTPPTPGLGFDRTAGASPSPAAGLASHGFDRVGLSLRSASGPGGATSAPPPPGFGATPDQPDSSLRLDLARGLLMQHQRGSSGSSGSGGYGGGGPGGGRGGPGGPGAVPPPTAGLSRERSGGNSGAAAALIGTRISEDQIYHAEGSSALLRPSELAAFDMGRPLSAPLDNFDDDAQEAGKRTSSFANLAAALGEGLAESMDDSLQKQQQQQQMQMQMQMQQHEYAAAAAVGAARHLPSVAEQRVPNGLSSLQAAAASRMGEGDDGRGLVSTNKGSSGELDNFARQSRHTASRLVGSSAASAAASAGHNAMGFDLRYSSATGTAVMPARMLASRDRRPSADGIGGGGGGGGGGSGSASGSGQQQVQSNLFPPPNYAAHSSSMIPLSSETSSTAAAYESGGSSGKNSPHIVHYAHHAQAPVGVTVTEPTSGKNTPQLIALMHGHSSQQQHRGASPAVSGHFVVDHRGGRSSAPPNILIDGAQAQGMAGARAYVAAAPPSQFPSATESPDSLHEYNRSREQSPRPSAQQIVPALDRALMIQAEVELSPFIWDVFGNDGNAAPPTPSSSRETSPVNKTSRGLAILHASHLFMPDVRSTCEAFGALMSFRPEFCRSRGVIFVSYHDLRSARYAAVELKACLKRLATPRGTAGNRFDDVQVQYCVPLNASAASDESALVVSNLPSNFDEQSIKAVMMSYGAVRGVRFDAMGEYSADKGRSYIVEFYDMQDAKQAVLELESTQPWGPDATVSVGVRHPSERKQGQDLLALIGRWRKEEPSHVEVGTTVNLAAGTSPSPLPSMEAANPRASSAHSSTSPASLNSDSVPPASTLQGAAMSSTSSSPRVAPPHVGTSGGISSQYPQPHNGQPTTQLVVGPDGQYSYVVMNQPHGHAVPPPHPGHAPHPHPGHAYVSAHHPPQPVQQQIVHGPHGTYVTTVPTQVYHGHHPHHLPPHIPTQYQHLPPGATVIATPYGHGYPASVPVYTHIHGPPTDSSVSSGSAGGMHQHQHQHGQRRHGTGGAAGSVPHRTHGNDEESTQLLLDIQAVESGRDTRTSLMVRNIPNKYTQKMLLDEFAEGGHGSDKIDFFYLPIDFKNKCNRGYAFVNFVDYRDIASFHHRYNGKHWKVFNSDKICDITYARIQGKAAMLKRFQNSALMEKEEDYKPVVFVSSGPNKGEREEFPAPSPHGHGHGHPHSPQVTSSLAAAAAESSGRGGADS